MAGFGKQPAGTSSAGYGSPLAGESLPGVILRNARTGQSDSSRLIDSRTRDYALDGGNGRLAGMSDVQQLVQITVTTEKNSSAVRGLGHELKSLDRITTNFERRVLAVLTSALQHLIDQRLVEIVGFAFSKGGPDSGQPSGRALGRLRWRDMTTGQEHQEPI